MISHYERQAANDVSAAERVDRGLLLLDLVSDVADWPARVDLTRLDIDSLCDCVVGQVYAHRVPEGDQAWTAFTIGTTNLGISGESMAYGFDASGPADAAAVEAEWRRVILERIEGAS